MNNNLEMLNYVVSYEVDSSTATGATMKCVVCGAMQGMEGAAELTKKDQEFCRDHYEKCYSDNPKGTPSHLPRVGYHIEHRDHWEKNCVACWIGSHFCDNRLAVPSYTPKALAQKLATDRTAEMMKIPYDDDSDNMAEDTGERVFQNRGKLLKTEYRIIRRVELTDQVEHFAVQPNHQTQGGNKGS